MLTVSLLGIAVRSIGLLALTSIVVLFARRTSASVHRSLWLTGILSVLVLPFVWRAAPEMSIAADRIPGFMRTIEQPVVANTLTKFGDLTEAKPHVNQATTSLIDPTPTPMNPITYLLIAWATVGIGLLLRIGFGLASVQRLISRASPHHDAEAVAQKISPRAAKRMRVLVSERVAVPATAGFLRPAIILPVESATWSDSKLKLVLAHELAHIHQADWLFSILAQITCAMYPFNPLVWVAAHRLQAECELAADDRALTAGIQPREYAEGLLEIARSARQRSPNLVAFARNPKVEVRLRAIMDSKRRRGKVALSLVAVIAAMSLSACGLVAAFRLGDPKPETQTQEAALAIPIADGNGWKGPLMVHVVDEYGAPCSHAKLTFLLEGSGIMGMGTADSEPITDVHGDYEIHPEKLKSFNSGLDKYFKSESLAYVFAYAPGHAMTASRFIKKGEKSLTVKLGKSNLVSIPLVGPDNKPASGVTVSALRFHRSGQATMFIPKAWHSAGFQAVTNAEGIATIKDIPEGWSVDFDVNDERYLPPVRRQRNPEVAGNTTYPAFHLTPSCSVEGTALLNGVPVAGLTIQANYKSPSAARQAVTDSNGHYRITRIPAGICDVHIVDLGVGNQKRLEDFVARQHDGLNVRVGQSVSGLDFNFEHGALITGRIVNQNGEARQAEVSATSPEFVLFREGPASNPTDYFAMSNDKDGKYRMRVPAGHYQVTVGIGDVPPVKEIDISDGQSVVADFKIQY